MLRALLHGITALFILASLILQILVILGNFNGLSNVNILRVDLINPSNNSDGGLLGGIFNTVKNTLDGNVIPNYVTMSLFKICEGLNSGENCSPPSWGFRYNSTGILNTIENNIPDSIHKTLTGIQGGVFVPSAVLCFLLLCYQLIHAFSYRNGCCGLVMIFTLAVISFIFSLATFIIQIVAYNQIKNALNNFKDSMFGGLFSNLVDFSTKIGASVWMSLAAFVLLFFVLVFLALSVCCFGRNRREKEEDRRQGWFSRRRRRRRREEYEMGHVF